MVVLPRVAKIAILQQTIPISSGVHSDPGAIALMHKLAAKSRERWPEWANPTARVGLPVKAG